MRKFNPSKIQLNGLLILIGLLVFSLRMFCQTTSPLQQGSWIKIGVTQSGFYHLNQAWFSKHQFNTQASEKICIYGTKSGILQPSDPTEAGFLQAIPIDYQKTVAGSWEILFWGESPHEVRQNGTWEQETNLYSDTTFYFVQLDAPQSKPIEEVSPSSASTSFLPYAWSLKHYEPETYNIIQSGQTWLGDAFYGNASKILQYVLTDYAEGKPAWLKMKLYASSIASSTFTIPMLAKPITMEPILGGRYDTKTSSASVSTWVNPTLANKNWNWPIQFQSSGGTGYIDYISLMYPRTFNAQSENPLYLLPNKSDSTININIANSNPAQQIWINNGGTGWRKISNTNAFQFRFKTNSQLAIADLTKANEPIFCGNNENQNTFSIPKETELLVLSSPVLLASAEKLARYKTEKRGIIAKEISTKSIYNDFSGGKQDVTAIRNFIHFQFQKAGSKLKYVILLGDASIDYKGQSIISTALEKTCFVPTYQSLESFQPLLSYASDDYYGIVGANTDVWDESTNPRNADLKVAIGRIPAKSPQEANMFIQKLADYESRIRTQIPQLAWVADDGDANIHMQDAEDFSGILESALFPGEQHKVYLDQYPMQQANGLYTSPLGTKAVMNLWEEKADFIHYMGHGSESGWADEKLLTTNDLIKLRNNKHLPLLLTATCQFGRYDDPNILSGGELSLLSDQGGAIALISTTRPVFQSSNYLFGQAFYRTVIKNKENSNYRLGDLFRDAKNQSQSGVINRNIQLLGDPTLTLPWTAASPQIFVDTSKKELNLTGLAIRGQKMIIQLHRMSESKSTLGTKNTAFNYQGMSSMIWKSSGQSSNNSLQIKLNTLPNLLGDQRYQIQAWSPQASAAITLSDWKNNQATDQQAPQISILLPNEQVLASSPNPLVSISIADSSGLAWQNAAGNIAYVTLDDSIRIELGPLISIKDNDPKQGTATIPLKALAMGNHKIQVFCWDIYNNYAQSSLAFRVLQEDPGQMHGRIYPNPLGKTLNFIFEQDKPWNLMQYELQLYHLNGQTILARTGTSAYLNNSTGLIEINWTDEEYSKINGNQLIEIKLKDDITNEIKIVRIKTSTLK
jgi:hypothetical protein